MTYRLEGFQDQLVTLTSRDACVNPTLPDGTAIKKAITAGEAAESNAHTLEMVRGCCDPLPYGDEVDSEAISPCNPIYMCNQEIQYDRQARQRCRKCWGRPSHAIHVLPEDASSYATPPVVPCPNVGNVAFGRLFALAVAGRSIEPPHEELQPPKSLQDLAGKSY